MAEKHSAALDIHICPKYEKAISIIGKRWTGLIIKALMERPLRFNELLKVVGTVSDRVLTERLRELEAEGLLERLVHSEAAVRIEYRLTPMGRSLEEVMNALQHWADQWIPLNSASMEELEQAAHH
jgi:DNA-binding HxlR family transcriptional regulator